MGLPVEMFYETEAILGVKCTLCLNVYDSPRRLSNCSHHYCRACIVGWLEGSDECVQCGSSGEIAPPTIEVLETISNLPAKCYYQALGCNARIPYKEIGRHTRRCEYRLSRCPRRCGEILPVVRMAAHILTCTSGIDPLLESLMCFRCAFIYTNGGLPSHCNYYDVARNVWHYRFEGDQNE